MLRRRAASARAFVAFALGLGLLTFVPVPRVEAGCPAPARTNGCCPSSAPPKCPACPGEGRSSAPAPSRAASCCSLAALLPGESKPEAQGPRAGRPEAAAAGTASKAATRAVSGDRRAVVAAASPPPRLLACAFRN